MILRPWGSQRAAWTASFTLLVSGFLLADGNPNVGSLKEQLNPCWNNRLAALDARLTGYLASCADLRATGVPKVRKVGDDLVIVVPNATENEFHVFAIGYATGHSGGPPEVAWQGGQLSDAINQACSGGHAR